jgi:hypothetical protein
VEEEELGTLKEIFDPIGVVFLEILVGLELFA